MCFKKKLLGIKLMKSFLVWYRAVSVSLFKLLFSFQHQLNYEYSQIQPLEPACLSWDQVWGLQGCVSG